MSKTIVLVYSGGLDTSVCIPMLREEYGYERIVTVTVDVGQPDEDVQRLRYRTFEGDRRRGREDPRGEAVARRDEAGAVSAPGRESDERQHNDVDRAEGQVGHAPRMLDAARFRRCRAPPRSREGPEGTGP